MNDTAAQGSHGNQPATLMHNQGKAMSPDGASSTGKTGEFTR